MVSHGPAEAAGAIETSMPSDSKRATKARRMLSTSPSDPMRFEESLPPGFAPAASISCRFSGQGTAIG